MSILNVVERRWPDSGSGPWALRLTFAIVDDRPGVVGVELYAIDPATIAADRGTGKNDAERWLNLPLAREAGKNPVPIQTSGVRLPLGELLDQYLASMRRSDEIVSRAPGFPAEWRQEATDRLGRIAEVTPTPGRPGRPPLYSRDHFERVADVYSRALLAGEPPTKAVSDVFSVSKSTAAKWVARCRELELLRDTDRGKPAGRPPVAPKTSSKRGAPRPRKGK